MLRIFLIAISLSTLIQAADNYFPTAKGSKWCYSKFSVEPNDNGGYDTVNNNPVKKEFGNDTVVNGVTFYKFYYDVTPGIDPEWYDFAVHYYFDNNLIRILRSGEILGTTIGQTSLLIPSRVGDTLKSSGRYSDNDSSYGFYTVLENGTDSLGAGKFTNTKAAICSVTNVISPLTDSMQLHIEYDKYIFAENVGLIRHIHYTKSRDTIRTNEIFTLDSFKISSTKSIIPFEKSLKTCEQIILSGNGFLFNSKDYNPVTFSIFNSAGQQIIRTSISPNSYIPFKSIGLNAAGNYILSTGKSSARYILQKN